MNLTNCFKFIWLPDEAGIRFYAGIVSIYLFVAVAIMLLDGIVMWAVYKGKGERCFTAMEVVVHQLTAIDFLNGLVLLPLGFSRCHPADVKK